MISREPRSILDEGKGTTFSIDWIGEAIAAVIAALF